MKKCIFPINLKISRHKNYFEPIREKHDLIVHLINAMEHMLGQKFKLDDECSLKQSAIVLVVDGFSRLFFIGENKIYSFNFPFTTVVDDVDRKISFRYDSMAIDWSLISKLRSAAKNLSNDSSNLIEILMPSNSDSICLEIEEYPIFFYLLSMEDGYIRYDYDMDRDNGRMHPLHHYDVFYHEKNTFKIGLNLNEPCCFDLFCDFLNNKKERFYIEIE